MSDQVRARLKKKRNAVLCMCGARDAKTGEYKCGGTFGAVDAMPIELRATEIIIDGAMLFLPATTRPYFTFAPGFQERSANLWALTDDARRRNDADKRRAAAGDPRDRRTIQAKERLEDDRSIRFRGTIQRQVDAKQTQPRHSAPLPTYSLCPECGTMNEIDEDVISGTS